MAEKALSHGLASIKDLLNAAHEAQLNDPVSLPAVNGPEMKEIIAGNKANAMELGITVIALMIERIKAA